MKYSPLVFGLMAGIIFSIFDSALFLFTEKKMTHYFEGEFPELDKDEIIILLSAISAAIALFIANFIDEERPYFENLEAIISMEDDELTHPDKEDSTEPQIPKSE